MYSYAATERLADEYGTTHIGPATGEIVACVLGVILIGVAFIAIGLFVSSLTENQLAAAVITVAILLVMLILELLNNFINAYWIRFIISWFSFMGRFSNFTAGILDFSAIVYYLSVAGVFLLLTVRVYDKRRWG